LLGPAEDLLDPYARLERSSIRSLDYRAVRDRIAIRKADFNDVGAPACQLSNYQVGGIQIWVAGRNEGNKCATPLKPEPSEKIVDRIHKLIRNAMPVPLDRHANSKSGLANHDAAEGLGAVPVLCTG